MFSLFHGSRSPFRTTRRKLYLGVTLLSLLALLALAMSTLTAAHAGQPPGRLTVDTFGDKDDLPNAPQAPVTCSRSQTGNGTIQGTIKDAQTGKPVANAYIGVSPGVINSFGCYTTTDTNGAFAIPKLPAGTYNLSASRWKVYGTDPLYRDSIIRQIPVGNGAVTIRLSLTPIPAPGYRVIGTYNSKNIFIVDMDETYFNSWFTDKHSVDNKLTPAVHNIAKLGVNATEEWTQYGYSPIDHYQLAVGGFPVWRTPDGPAPYWTQPDPNLDTNLWYSGGPQTGEEFGQESIFDVAKSYGMSTAVIGGNDYPVGHITDANVDQIQLNGNNPCKAPLGEEKQIENFVNGHLSNQNGVLVYVPLTQDEGFNTENISPDAPPSVIDCKQSNGWTYTQGSVWDDQTFGALLNYLNKTKQGNQTLMQNSTIIVTSDEAQNDKTNFDNFYPTQPGEPTLGTSRHTPFVIEGPNIKQNVTYTQQMRIDDSSVNAMASLGLPAPADARGKYIPAFFQHQPDFLLPFAQHQIIPSQGFIPLLENGVGDYSTVIEAQNETTTTITQASLTVYDQAGKTVFQKSANVPIPPYTTWAIYANQLGLPKGFVGTAVLHADQPVALVSTQTPDDKKDSAKSVEGYIAAEVGSRLFAPIVDNAVNSNTTSLAITNLAPCQGCGTTVYVSFYNSAGKLLGQKHSHLAANGQVIVSPASGLNIPGNTVVSAVVASNPPEPLGATAYTTSSSSDRSFSYNAPSSGDTSLTSSQVYNNVSGATTSLVIQNTTKSAATATVTYLDQSGNTVVTKQESLGAYATVTESAANVGLPSGFIGSAKITATQKVGIVSLIALSTGDTSAFNAVRSSDFTYYTPVLIPQVENAYYGYTSAVTVTNSGTTATTAEIHYYDPNGNPTGNTPTASLAPGASYTFNQGDSSSGLPSYFVGSAYVSSSAVQHLAASVTVSGKSQIRSFSGSQAQTGQLLLTVAQMRQNYTQFTGDVVTLQNAIVTRSFTSNWFVQDSTGGIRIYMGGGANQQMGDIETITGVLTDYSGEIEIDPQGSSSVTKTGTGTVPNPVVITTAQIAQLQYTDVLDGELVTVSDSTITTYNPPSLGLTDSSGVEGAAYFDSYAQKNIDLSQFQQGEQVVTTGVLQMYGSDLQHATGEISPLLTSDFVKYQ